RHETANDMTAVTPASGAPSSRGGAPEGLVAVVVTLDRQQQIGVSTAPVERRALASSLRAPGVVEAPESATAQVHVRAPGFIERVAVRESGVHVVRGQTLAYYYSPQIYQAEQELLTAQRWVTSPRVPSSPHESPNVGAGPSDT